MLTQYDEFPVHQSSYPFSEIPSTDYGWDDGYFFGVYNAEEKAFFFSGMRVNPNNDMLGGYAGITIDEQQYTARFSRPWRANADTTLGPLSYRFVEPMKRIQLALGPNDSELTFEMDWIGTGVPYEEPHHLAWSRGRRTTDQTRLLPDRQRQRLDPAAGQALRAAPTGVGREPRPLVGALRPARPPSPRPAVAPAARSPLSPPGPAMGLLVDAEERRIGFLQRARVGGR